MKVSVIMPVYNEQDTILQAVEQVMRCVSIPDKEVIVVDDGSTDATPARLKQLADPSLRLVTLPENRGKGAAVRAGLEKAAGDVVIIQDADLEYSPDNYPSLLKPILDGKADAVYGTRLQGGSGPQRVLFFWHYVGNRILTTFSNMFTNLNLSDMEVGLKVFRAEVIRKIRLEENRFGFEPEITAKLARLNCRIYEVPVSYYGRTYSEGKKINWTDGVWALFCIVRYALFK